MKFFLVWVHLGYIVIQRRTTTASYTENPKKCFISSFVAQNASPFNKKINLITTSFYRCVNRYQSIGDLLLRSVVFVFVRLSKIRVGSRVSGAVGPLIDTPTSEATRGGVSTATAADASKRKRKVRERYTGLVAESVSGRTWRVLWDQTDQFEDVYAAKLKFEKEGVVDATVLRRLRDKYPAAPSSAREEEEQQALPQAVLVVVPAAAPAQEEPPVVLPLPQEIFPPPQIVHPSQEQLPGVVETVLDEDGEDEEEDGEDDDNGGVLEQEPDLEEHEEIFNPEEDFQVYDPAKIELLSDDDIRMHRHLRYQI